MKPEYPSGAKYFSSRFGWVEYLFKTPTKAPFRSASDTRKNPKSKPRPPDFSPAFGSFLKLNWKSSNSG
jgi:hypothetical protein